MSDLYVYTFREFGESQADAYSQSLEETLTRLGENPELGIDASSIRKRYRRFVHKRHSVYYGGAARKRAHESGKMAFRGHPRSEDANNADPESHRDRSPTRSCKGLTST